MAGMVFMVTGVVGHGRGGAKCRHGWKLLVSFEPAAGAEFSRDAREEQHEADGEGAENPVDLHAALEHETVEQGEHEDEHGCFGEEGGAARRGDRNEFEERGGRLPVRTAARGYDGKAGDGGGRLR